MGLKAPHVPLMLTGSKARICNHWIHMFRYVGNKEWREARNSSVMEKSKSFSFDSSLYLIKG